MASNNFVRILVSSLFLAQYIHNFVRGEPQVPCYFIFGDSLADPGNNNELLTLARSNYPPYGVDFRDGPTGRFTNNRTIPDIIGQFLGLDDYIPPHANLLGKDILKGVNYGSTISGIRDETGSQASRRLDDPSSRITMADGAKSDVKKPINTTSPFFLSPSDSPGATLVSSILTGDNYATWAKAMKRALRAKNKLGFIDGSLEKHDPSSPDFDIWDICNNMIVSWIFNSLDKSLQASLAYVDDAQEIWTELKERYSQGNAQRIHQLKKEISRLEQGGDTVVGYYTKLKALWDELDEYVEVHECTCSSSAKQAREKEVEKLHQFLMGLNTDIYGSVCSQILNTEPLPSVSKAFSIVNQEERRKIIPKRDDRIEGAAFAGIQVDERGNRWLGPRERPICDYCQRTGHDRPNCWKLHGRPVDWESKYVGQKPKHKGRGGAAFRGGPSRFHSQGGQTGQRASHYTQAHSAGQPSQTEKAGAVMDVGHEEQANSTGQGSPAITGLTGEQYRELLDFLHKLKNPTEHLSAQLNTQESCCPVIEDVGICVPGSTPCPDRALYAYFNGLHPTDMVNAAIAQRAYDEESSSDTFPYGIRLLVQLQ